MQRVFPSLLLACLLTACSDGGGNYELARPPAWHNTALVDVLAGTVNGHVAANNTWSWKGIPFAEPPLGENRFSAPKPPQKRTETLQATDFGNACVQLDALTAGVVGDEDCLTLNVWRPQTAEDKLPVYVWIHGGGNTSGSADQADYDGANRAAGGNLVFVSMQYRLGPFGWFLDPSLQVGDADTNSGNFGTLDLIRGLEWIRDNIEQFGGDPENVIITGESGGGINVLSLLLSPRAEGLFDKALSQSGFFPSISMADGLNFGAEIKPRIMVAEDLADTEQEAREKLAGMHADEVREFLLSAAPASFMNSIEQIGVGLLSMPFIYPDGHVVVSEGKAAFAAGTYPNKVPLMVGTNAGDIRLFLFLLEPALLADPPLYNASSDIGGMLWKAAGADELALAMTRHSDQPPVYVYLYAWGRYRADGSGVTPMPWNYFMGAAHALDIPFFLDNLDKQGFFAEINYTEENRPGREALGAAMVSYVDGFIQDGVPAADGLPDWWAWSNNPGDGKYLELNADLLETQIAMATEAVTQDTAKLALESIEDPVLREQVRTVLTEFVVTCALISDNPATDCGVE